MNDTDNHWRRKCIVICLLALFIGLLGIFLPEVDTGEILYINASGVSQVGLASFACTNISNISDINGLNCSGNEGTTPWYIDVNFTNITNFSYLESKMLYFSTVGQSTHVNDIEIFCETEGEFVDLITFTNEVEWFYFTRNFPESMHFIRSDGNVTIRYNHSQNGNTNHRIILDTVRLVVKPTFEKNVINLNQTIGGGSGASSLSQLTIDTNKNWQGYSLYNLSILNLSNNIDMLGFGLLNSSTNITTPGGTYYIGKNGTDTVACGGATTPCLTIGYFVAKLNAKPVLLGNVTAHIYSGVYDENVVVGGVYPGNYRLTFEGEYKIIDSLIISSASAGSTATQANFSNNTAMTADKYKDKIMYVFNGSNAGQYRIVDNNSADNLTYVGLLTNALVAGTRIDILEWNTTIKPTNPVSMQLESMGNVYINDIALDGGISTKSSVYFINRANLTTYFISTNPFLTSYSVQMFSTYEVDTSIINHDSTPNYVLWYSQLSNALMKKSKIDRGTDYIGLLVQHGYFLSQEGNVYNNSANSIYIDNNANFQADFGNGVNPQMSFVKYSTTGINIVDGTCTGCTTTDAFPGIVNYANTINFQTKYSGTGTDYACFNANGTLIRQNLAC